jgi:hypothetical protein
MPVADMLAHSPRLPLTLDYNMGNEDLAAEDEEGAILSLKQYNRVRLQMPATSLQKLIIAHPDEDKSYATSTVTVTYLLPFDRVGVTCLFFGKFIHVRSNIYIYI